MYLFFYRHLAGLGSDTLHIDSASIVGDFPRGVGVYKADCGDCSVASQLDHAFLLEPGDNTVNIFMTGERLVHRDSIYNAIDCINMAGPCSRRWYCGEGPDIQRNRISFYAICASGIPNLR